VTEIVVADADGASRRGVTAALRFGGHTVHAVRETARAASAVRRIRPDAVIVNPVGAAATVVELRCVTDAPIIVVATSGDPSDKVSALDAGADDYLVAPVDPDELLARLRVALRHHGRDGAERAPIVTPDFVAHLADRRWFLTDGSEVRLTPMEWRLVEVLAERPGRLVTQAELLQRVWGPKALDRAHYLRVQMAAIRAKVEPEPGRPRYFITAPGLGVRFEPGDQLECS
jgi:two-component system, OmpR family, KDP operon response regulator KdpE